jgi:tetratricopeptide (TPR) repeat protein
MNGLTTETVEAAIAQIDARIAADPLALALQIDRARFLELLGRKDEAVEAYVTVLARDPVHVEALNALGLLTLSTGNRAAARTLLSGAVLHGPDHAAAHANLAYVLMLDEQPEGARSFYERALELDPTLAVAHHGMAELLARHGDPEGAERHRALGLRYRPLTLSRFRGEGRPVRVLALGSAAFGNVATAAYFDDRVFLLASLVVEYDDPALPLPPHDLVFNAIGEADLCAGPLASAAAILRRTSAPVINHPAAVAATSRAANAQRLARILGVVTPRMVQAARAELSGPGASTLLSERGLHYPLLVRSPGYHTGEHFVKVDSAADLAPAIATLPGDELLVIEYLDTRDARDDFRKYRVMIVNGELFPLHVAISRRWKVHYFRADMAVRAEHRAEDAAFLHDMRAALGADAVAALEKVSAVLGLDYGGIDFTIDTAGNVIVFEANASMIVPLPEADAMWDYRREPVARIHAAVRAMLLERSSEPAPNAPNSCAEAS